MNLASDIVIISYRMESLDHSQKGGARPILRVPGAFDNKACIAKAEVDGLSNQYAFSQRLYSWFQAWRYPNNIATRKYQE